MNHGRSDLQSREGSQDPSESLVEPAKSKVEVKPAKSLGVSWTDLAGVEPAKAMDVEPKSKSSTGSSWAELAAGPFELVDPYRVEGGLKEREQVESLRSLGDPEHSVKTSGFRCPHFHSNKDLGGYSPTFIKIIKLNCDLRELCEESPR